MRIGHFFLGVMLLCNVLSVAIVLFRADVGVLLWINLFGCVIFGAWLRDQMVTK